MRIFLFFILILITAIITWYALPEKTTAKVLLITSSQQLEPVRSKAGEPLWTIWSASPDKAKGYVDLLSVHSIPYDVAWIDEPDSLSIFYTTLKSTSHSFIILALNNPDPAYDTALLELIKKANAHDVPVMADVNSMDPALMNYFRITYSAESFLSGTLQDSLTQKIYNFTPRHFRNFKLQANQKIIASANNQPVAIISKTRKTNNYIIGVSGEEFLARVDPFQDYIKKLIIFANEKGLVYVSLEKTAVLRIDDPGASHKIWQLSKKYDTMNADITAEQWGQLAEILKQRNAQLSIMYTPFFIDDGDASLGDIMSKGMKITKRECGETYPSNDMAYFKNNPPHLFDLASEYTAMRKGASEDAFDIQLHGFAHVTPDIARWCNEPDKISNELLMAEFYDPIDKKSIPAHVQYKRMWTAASQISMIFDHYPTAFSPPLHFYDYITIRTAKKLGIPLLHALTLYQLYSDPIIENDKIRTIWAHRFAGVRRIFIQSGYPLVLGFHDWDFKNHSIEWFGEYLDQWKKQGIARFISFSELADYLSLRTRTVVHSKNIMEINFTLQDIPHFPWFATMQNSFFYKHHAVIMIKVPTGKKLVSVFTSDKKALDFSCSPDSTCAITLPLFRTPELTCTAVFARQP